MLYQDGTLNDEDVHGNQYNDKERVIVGRPREEILAVGDFDEVHLDELVDVFRL